MWLSLKSSVTFIRESCPIILASHQVLLFSTVHTIKCRVIADRAGLCETPVIHRLPPVEKLPVCLPAFSRPRYEGWPNHKQSFSIDVCLPHSLLVLSVTTQTTILCCLSMSSWVYLEYGSLGLYLVLIPSSDSPISFSMSIVCQFHFFHRRK